MSLNYAWNRDCDTYIRFACLEHFGRCTRNTVVPIIFQTKRHLCRSGVFYFVTKLPLAVSLCYFPVQYLRCILLKNRSRNKYVYLHHLKYKKHPFRWFVRCLDNRLEPSFDGKKYFTLIKSTDVRLTREFKNSSVVLKHLLIYLNFFTLHP